MAPGEIFFKKIIKYHTNDDIHNTTQYTVQDSKSIFTQFPDLLWSHIPSPRPSL